MGSANPWFMLAVLFVARTSTGYVFQSIGSSGPAIAAALAVDFALIGTLIGLYKFPGIILSLPSGMLGRSTSDRNIIGAGLAIMALGCAITAMSDSYALAAAGRLTTGIGATISNLYFTKVVLDWFADSHSLPLAMAILVNSWPLGIALGLMTQGPITIAWNWQGAVMVSCTAALTATLLLFALYREAPGRTLPPATGIKALLALSRDEWLNMVLIGLVWSALNVALAMVFGFAPALLNSRGYDLASAGYLIGIGTWIGIIAIPAGGALASHTGRGTTIMFVCTMAAGVVYAMLAAWPDSLWLYAAFGIFGFAAAGPIMAQPAKSLRNANRAAGMGIFYTIYYLCMGLLPSVAGGLHDIHGPHAPISFAAMLMVLSLVAQGFLKLRSNRARCDLSGG